MQKKLMLAVGIAASSLILAATTTLAAQNTTNNNPNGNRFGLHQRENQGVIGTISAISGNTLTVTTRERGSETDVTKTITVSSDTKFTKDRDTTIALSDLAIGQKVMVHGATDNSGNITATVVNIETKALKHGPQAGKGRGTFGTISAISGNTLTVTTRERGSETDVTKTITVSSDTKFTKDRDTTIALSDLAIGQKVMVHGATDNSGNITATVVNIETKALQSRGPQAQ